MVARVGVTIIAALLFSPIKDQFQVWLDKFFYGERYSVRHTLVDFGRTWAQRFAPRTCSIESWTA